MPAMHVSLCDALVASSLSSSEASFSMRYLRTSRHSCFAFESVRKFQRKTSSTAMQSGDFTNMCELGGSLGLNN